MFLSNYSITLIFRCPGPAKISHITAWSALKRLNQFNKELCCTEKGLGKFVQMYSDVTRGSSFLPLLMTSRRY